MHKIAILLLFLALTTTSSAQPKKLPDITMDSISVVINFGQSKVFLFDKSITRMDWAKLIQKDTLLINYFRRWSNTGECEIRISNISKISKTGFEFRLVSLQVYPPNAEVPLLRGMGSALYFVTVDNENINEAAKIIGIKFLYFEI